MAENEKRDVSKRRLRNYLVNRHDQLRIVLITLIYMSVSVILIVGIVLYPYRVV